MRLDGEPALPIQREELAKQSFEDMGSQRSLGTRGATSGTRSSRARGIMDGQMCPSYGTGC